VENEYTSEKLVLLGIFVPKIFTIGRNLTKFWQKISLHRFFWDTVYKSHSKLSKLFQNQNTNVKCTISVILFLCGVLTLSKFLSLNLRAGPQPPWPPSDYVPGFCQAAMPAYAYANISL